ncbi:uncharacterized protein LOC128105112 isoform X1 [Peromyscus californicus insignis]|uniref:uncharacterized protein LOC128105112 isoform X1 n=1 Tax=Peromyscus californicus insignis TaxID=564181 RepID=UPI0022A660ED|nr:uncharacterized protein LOC128105112 isoform X1 [Peromyscus californicus insignis]
MGGGGGVGPSFALLHEVGVRSHRTVWKRSRGSHCILLRSWKQSRRSLYPETCLFLPNHLEFLKGKDNSLSCCLKAAVADVWREGVCKHPEDALRIPSSSRLFHYPRISCVGAGHPCCGYACEGYSLFMVDYIDRLVYVEPSLHLWIETYFIMVNLFDVFLNSVFPDAGMKRLATSHHILRKPMWYFLCTAGEKHFCLLGVPNKGHSRWRTKSSPGKARSLRTRRAPGKGLFVTLFYAAAVLQTLPASRQTAETLQRGRVKLAERMKTDSKMLSRTQGPVMMPELKLEPELFTKEMQTECELAKIPCDYYKVWNPRCKSKGMTAGASERSHLQP